MKYLWNMLMGVGFVFVLIGIVLVSQPLDPYLADNMCKVQIYNEWGYVGMGSGFLYEDGMVMTAGHVVEDANNFKIVYSDGTEESASVYKASRYDIGIIYVDRDCEEPVSWNVSSLEPGVTVFTQGYPYDMDVLRLSRGIVSSVEWSTPAWPTVIAVDAEGGPGNSGGPLLDKRGRVCGIVVGLRIVVGIGSVVLCVPGRLLLDFVNNPDGEDHEKEATDYSEIGEEIRRSILSLH